MSSQLDREPHTYPFSVDAVSDALTVADQTTGPHGKAMTTEERMSDMLRRHGPGSANAWARPLGERYLRAAAVTVTERLQGVGAHIEIAAAIAYVVATRAG